MELPAAVLVHSTILGLKGGKATLVRISEEGFYEVNLTFGEKQHRAYLPIVDTVVIARSAEEEIVEDQEIER